MDARLPLAERIEQLLDAELGHRIDRTRLLASPLYARDVLLACEALRSTDGPALAAAFKQAAQPTLPEAIAPAEVPAWPHGDTSGFGYTTPGALEPPRLRFIRRPWFSASRWLDR